MNGSPRRGTAGTFGYAGEANRARFSEHAPPNMRRFPLFLFLAFCLLTLGSTGCNAVPRTRTEPRPVSKYWRMPAVPWITQPVGKSGPFTYAIRPSSVMAAGFDTDYSFMLWEIAGDDAYFQSISRTGASVDSGVIHLDGADKVRSTTDTALRRGSD